MNSKWPLVIVLTAGASCSASHMAPPPSSPASAEDAVSPEAAANREAIGRLGFLAGSWTGEGWSINRQGVRQTFRSSEKVEPRLGGQLLLVEGKHESLEPGQVGKIVHQALATISWDPRGQLYRFRSFTSAGQSGDFEGRVESGAFIWILPLPGAQIRYAIRLDAQGRWSEIGERSTDGATTWTTIFSMTLTRG